MFCLSNFFANSFCTSDVHIPLFNITHAISSHTDHKTQLEDCHLKTHWFRACLSKRLYRADTSRY